MTEETRQRAIKALLNAEVANDSDARRFPMVFVCGSHIFFTYMAAVRMQKEYALMGYMVKIELVRTPLNMYVSQTVDQRGSIYPGEIFPSKDYERLIA